MASLREQFVTKKRRLQQQTETVKQLRADVELLEKELLESMREDGEVYFEMDGAYWIMAKKKNVPPFPNKEQFFTQVIDEVAEDHVKQTDECVTLFKRHQKQFEKRKLTIKAGKRKPPESVSLEALDEWLDEVEGGPRPEPEEED